MNVISIVLTTRKQIKKINVSYKKKKIIIILKLVTVFYANISFLFCSNIYDWVDCVY